MEEEEDEKRTRRRKRWAVGSQSQSAAPLGSHRMHLTQILTHQEQNPHRSEWYWRLRPWRHS